MPGKAQTTGISLELDVDGGGGSGGDVNIIEVGGTPVTSPLPVSSTEVSPTTVFNGVKLVAAAGTQVALASSTPVKAVTVKALSDNTDMIFVGNSSVSSSDGFQLSAGDSVSMDIANLATVFIDSAVNGEGVSYLGVN